jgi:hypothetical protein
MMARTLYNAVYGISACRGFPAIDIAAPPLSALHACKGQHQHGQKLERSGGCSPSAGLQRCVHFWRSDSWERVCLCAS